MRFLLLALLLAGCSKAGQVVLSTDEWRCSRTGEVTETNIMVVGTTPMPMKKTTVRCVEWSRI